MHPYKKARLDAAGAAVTSDPFDAEDDWDNDDEILALVESEVPTYSQMSQAIRAPAVTKPASSTSSTQVKKGGIVFKKPSSVTSKPASYTNNHTTIESEVSKHVGSQWCGTSAPSSHASQPHSNGSLLGVVDSEDVTTLRKQISDLVRKQHAHEGEIKWLRSTLQDKDKQMTTLRSNMNAESAKQKLQNSEKERGFAREIENLRSELQFKESEVMNVNQALDKLKRERAANKPAPMSLGADGFPMSSDVLGASPKKSRSVVNSKSMKRSPKSEKMDVDSVGTPVASGSDDKSMDIGVCDLKPVPEHRLKPRTLTMAKYKQKMLVSNMLKSNLTTVRDHVEAAQSLTDRDKCLELISQSLACAKQFCNT